MSLVRLFLSGVLIAGGLILGAFTLHGYLDPDWAQRRMHGGQRRGEAQRAACHRSVDGPQPVRGGPGQSRRAHRPIQVPRQLPNRPHRRPRSRRMPRRPPSPPPRRRSPRRPTRRRSRTRPSARSRRPPLDGRGTCSAISCRKQHACARAIGPPALRHGLPPFLSASSGAKCPRRCSQAIRASAGSAASAVDGEEQWPADRTRYEPGARGEKRPPRGGQRRQQRILRRRMQGIAAQRRQVGDEDHRADGAGEVLEHDGNGQRACASPAGSRATRKRGWRSSAGWRRATARWRAAWTRATAPPANPPISRAASPTPLTIAA